MKYYIYFLISSLYSTGFHNKTKVSEHLHATLIIEHKQLSIYKYE